MTMTPMINYSISSLAEFQNLYHSLQVRALRGEVVPNDQWHAQDVSSDPNLVSLELENVVLKMPVLPEIGLQHYMLPNLPWAEDHFLERVSGKPLNPPPSEAYWPFAQQGNARHKEGEKFSHTYPERYWPKLAGLAQGPYSYEGLGGNRGIRYAYGDLIDVVRLLQKHPLTRQAYLPIFFPEDTGAVSGQRLPCSLGYHFLQRREKLHVTYFMRSCDLMRHFVDDLYMTARLLGWVCEQVGGDLQPGFMTAHITSLHIFKGDIPIIRRNQEELKKVARQQLYGEWY